MTARPVDEPWGRVVSWLATRAPASRRALGPGAAPERIGGAFTRLRVPAPPDLVTVLVEHDGARDGGGGDAAHFLPGHMRPLPLEEIVRWHRRLTGILEGLDAERYEEALERWWHPQWVPFASDGMGAVLAIDQRPGPRRGAVGAVDRVEGWHRDAWPSLSVMAAEIADALEHGGESSARQRPTVEDGRLTWL